MEVVVQMPDVSIQLEVIGKKDALKKYDQFTLNTSCFLGNEVPDQILQQLCNFTIFLLQKLINLLLLLK